MPEFNPNIHCYLRKPNNRGKARLENLTGQKFNRLLVYSLLGMTDSIKGCRETHWLCCCDCGKWWTTTTLRLKNGQSQSCGCWNRDKVPYSKTHGKSKTLAYRIWSGIYTRSFNLSHKSSKRYGQIGLIMCQGIRRFEDFYTLMGDPPTKLHSIDRWPDGNGGYWCGQCHECEANGHSKNMRWATPLEQAEHMRTNVYLTYNGVTHHLSEWARIRKIKVGTLSQRIRKGWSTGKALDYEPRIMHNKQIVAKKTNSPCPRNSEPLCRKD